MAYEKNTAQKVHFVGVVFACGRMFAEHHRSRAERMNGKTEMINNHDRYFAYYGCGNPNKSVDRIVSLADLQEKFGRAVAHCY